MRGTEVAGSRPRLDHRHVLISVVRFSRRVSWHLVQRVTVPDVADQTVSFRPASWYRSYSVAIREHLTRRRVLAGAGALAVAATVDALAIEPAWLDVHRAQVLVESLPKSLHGFTVAQITDTHLTVLGRVETEILRAIQEASPQLVVLTGDLIDSLDHAPALAELCAELTRTGAQVVATLGNWEHWGHIDRVDLDRVYRASGATLLVDRWLDIGGLSLYATDDSTGGTPVGVRPGGSRRSRGIEGMGGVTMVGHDDPQEVPGAFQISRFSALASH